MGIKRLFRRLVFTTLIITNVITIIIALYFYTQLMEVDKSNSKEMKINSTSSSSFGGVKLSIEKEIEEIKAVPKQEKPISDIQVEGWIPDWDIIGGLNSVKKNQGTFQTLSPVWYIVNDDGSLKDTAKTNNQELIKYTKDKKINLIPTITIFGNKTFNNILSNPDNYQRHISTIVKKVNDNNYDGIDLDYESIYAADKDIFIKFLKELSEQLHRNNKKLIFSALAKWSDNIANSETIIALDYKKISDYVDTLRIQGYAYSVASSTVAGPIGPLSWLEDVIRYSIKSGVPREKIVLGIHTYGLDWSERPKLEDNIDYFGLNRTKPSSDNNEKALAYLYGNTESILKKYNAKVSFNESWGESVATYVYQNRNRILVYMDQKGIEVRKKLAASYGIKGICYWRIGSEENLKY